MNLGTNIRHFRRQAGLTQAELAGKVGVKQYAIAKYEKEMHSPTPEALAKIAQALGIAVGELYGVNSKNGVVAERKGSGSRREAEIQKIFRELPPAKQRAVLEHAKGLRREKS